MKDRVSTKILDNGATRYGVYDETGKLLRYEYIKLEDEPDEEGDFFNKANMLPDSIPAALGLKMENPQVKDALNVLANIGNVHVWQRVQSGVTDYLTSTDRNAYTEGTVDSTTITYLGQLGGGARIEVGSYVGTGTYGSLNPITLTFVGIPKLVIVEREQESVNAYSNGLGVFFYGQKIAQVHWNLNGSGYSNVNVVLSWNQNAVSWYGDDSSAHLNDENTTYHYIAIG